MLPISKKDQKVQQVCQVDYLKIYHHNQEQKDNKMTLAKDFNKCLKIQKKIIYKKLLVNYLINLWIRIYFMSHQYKQNNTTTNILQKMRVKQQNKTKKDIKVNMMYQSKQQIHQIMIVTINRNQYNFFKRCKNMVPLQKEFQLLVLSCDFEQIYSYDPISFGFNFINILQIIYFEHKLHNIFLANRMLHWQQIITYQYFSYFINKLKLKKFIRVNLIFFIKIHHLNIFFAMQNSQAVPIKIQVLQPQTNNSAKESFVTYLVVGSDKNGQFSIRRRYNDFYVLRQQLVERWLGLYVPPIASKKVTGNKQQKFVEERKRFLHYFCIKISQRPYLFYSAEFQLFLRGDIDIQKSFKELPLISYKEKLQIYKEYFQKLNQKANSAEILLMNQNDYEYLKKAEKRFDTIRQEFKNVAEIKKMYANQFVHVYNNILPEYEQKFLLHHVGKDRQKFIINKDDVKNQLKQYQNLANHNPLQEYVQMISYELRQARALVEAVQTRKKAQQRKQKLQKKRKQLREELQKLQSGKSTIKSFFTSGNKQQQIQRLQKEISEFQANIQYLNDLIPLMNIACNAQIKSYKIKRGKQYVNVLKQVAKKEIKQLSTYGHILKVPLAQFD